MLHRHRVVLLLLTLIGLLPSAAKAGQGGLITLVNGTPYNWRSSGLRSYQMNSWSFPEVITAGSTTTLYVEWSEAIFHEVAHDYGTVTFSLEGTGQTFQLEATAANGFNLRVILSGLSTLGHPQGSIIDLGWQHDGFVNFILAGEANNLTSSHMPNAWMHENLGVLGSRKLRHLCIPGSHDAGMSMLTGGTFWAGECNTVTQTQGVLAQLDSGVRYFDIRPVVGGGQFVAGHYSCDTPSGCQGGNGQSLASIIDDVNTYTAANPELVVLSLSHDYNTDAGRPYRPFTEGEWCSLLTQLRRLNHRFIAPHGAPRDLTTLTLGDFIGSGAAVVVVGNPADPNISFDRLSGCGFVPAGEGFYTPQSFPVFDDYSNTDNLGAMQQDQLTKLHVQRPNPDATPFLLSWTLTLQGVDNFPCFGSILGLADHARPALYQSVLPVSNRRTYPNILSVDGVNNSDIAALAMAVNSKAAWDRPKGYAIYKGPGSDSGIYVAYSPDSNLFNGGAWSLTRMNPAINTSATPAAVSFAGNLYVFYKGSGDDSRIYVAKPEGGNILAGEFWNAQPLNPAINTSTSPGAAVHNNTLYMLYKGAGTDSGVYIAKSSNGNVSDGNSWSASRLNPAINTSAAPAVTAFNGILYMLYKGPGGDANIYIARSTGGDVSDGSTWNASRLNPGINTSDAPGVVVYNGALYMFYKGFGGDANIYIARSTGGDIMDGAAWTFTRLNPGINTTGTPKPVVIGNSLYLFYKGMEGNIWIAQPQGTDVFDGNAWTWERLNPAISTSAGPGAAAM